MKNKITTVLAAGAVALAGVFAPASEAKAGDREDAFIGGLIGGLLGSTLGNNGGFNGGNINIGNGIRVTPPRNNNQGVYLSCGDKRDAYESLFDRAARDGRITPQEHRQLETIRSTPVSRNRSCSLPRYY